MKFLSSLLFSLLFSNFVNLSRAQIKNNALFKDTSKKTSFQQESSKASTSTLNRPWLTDPSQPISQRVSSLMSQMTLDEKIAQLSADCSNTLNYTQESWQSTSFGTIGIECSSHVDLENSTMADRIQIARQYQLDAIKYSRLGIPVTFHIETSHCGAAGGTIFPMGITQGASWNITLVGEIASTIALEARSWGGSRGLSPEINVVTDPRFGRSEENFGSDPLLVTKMTEQAVLGLQGIGQPDEYLINPLTTLIGEAKHCCVYGYSGLDGGSADVDDKTLHDVYLKPWRSFIKNGGRGIMVSHNNLNSIPMHMHSPIMKDLFRGTFGYKGFFGSDWQNINFLQNAHVAANLTQAAALAISAGVDNSFCDSAYYNGIIEPALQSGEISITDVDRAVAMTLQSKFAAGLFDGVLPDPTNRVNIYTDTSRALARQAASEGAVLLTNNNNILPLDLSKYKNIAILGPMSGCQEQAPSLIKDDDDDLVDPLTCKQTQNTDCNGADITKILNISDPSICCSLCQNLTACTVAVLATDQNICLLKSSCPSPSTNAARLRIDVRPPPPPTPWTCNAMRSQLGGYSNLERDTDAVLDNHAHVVTLLEAALVASSMSGNEFNISWASGVEQQGYDISGIPEAVTLAQASDLSILMLGDGGESIGYDSSVSCGEGADRPSLDLPGVQLDLLSAIIATGKPVILILSHGRPVTFGADYGGSLISKFGGDNNLPSLDKRASAVLASFRSGCEGGNALWDLLTGIVSPSGRLPQSWPISSGAVRMPGITPWYIKWTDQGGAGFTLNQPFKPNYPFGFGLDYLQVSISSSSALVDIASMTVNVTINLRNSAIRNGQYVVQVYFSQSLSRYSRFQRMLGGFTKVYMPTGPSGTISTTISIPFADMAHYDPLQKWMFLEQGEYTFSVCSNSDESTCKDTDKHTVMIPTTYTNL
jgi:beta-glucosidase